MNAGETVRRKWSWYRALPLSEQFKVEWQVFLAAFIAIYGATILAILAVTFL